MTLIWTLAGAATSAAFAWWMTWDFLGETLRLALVFTLGGAAAGVLVGQFTTRSLVPVLGLVAANVTGGCALIGGLWAGVWVARNPMLQSAGAIPWWPDLLSLTLLVATATFAAVGLGSAIALIGALVRRARGTAVPARVVTRLAVATVAAVAIGIAGRNFPKEPLFILMWNLHHVDRASPWYERREQLFGKVLDDARCEVLVVPPEARGASLDRVGRDLIARHLAAAITDRTGVCVADIDLVHRALGEQNRRFDWDRVYRLADRLGARWIVRGDAAVAAGTWNLRLMSYRREATGKPWEGVANIGWDALPVRDEQPPELPVILQAAELPAQLGFTVRAGQATLPTVAPDNVVPIDPARLADGGEHPWTRAERLQLVALMVPPDFNEADDLWARSLVALRHAPASAERTRALGARAWLHLHRRLHAEQLVEGLPSVEARLVLARVRGNLTEASRLLGDMPEGLSRLVASVEVERLRGVYHDTAGFAERWRGLADAYPRYVPYLSRALASGAWFYDGIEQSVAGELDGKGVSLAPPWWTRVAGVAVRLALHVDVSDAFVPEVSGRIETAYHDAWLDHAQRWRAPANDQVETRDLMEVLFMINRSLARDRFVTRANRQGQEERAFDEALSLPVELRRMPLMLSTATFTGRTYGGEKPTPSQLSLRWGAYRISQLLFQTEDGETPVAGAIVNVGHNFTMTIPDEPMRPWRQLAELYANDFWENPHRLGIAARHYGRGGRLTDTDFDLVERQYNVLAHLGRDAEAERLLSGLGDRFHGDWHRLQFERVRVRKLFDVRERLALMPQMLVGWGDQWNLRTLLARTQAMGGDIDAASASLETWPGFDGHGQNPVTLANNAEEASYLLLWFGNTPAARIMGERAAAYDTGAAAENTARCILAVLDRRWPDATAAQLEIHRQYQSEGTLSRAAWYARIGGDVKLAAALRGRADLDALAVTSFAFAANFQIQGLQPAQVMKAVESFSDTGDREALESFRSRLLYGVLAIDRRLDPVDADALHRRFGGDPADVVQLRHAARERATGGDYRQLVALLEPGFGGVRQQPVHDQHLGFGELLPFLVLGLAETGRTVDASWLVDVWRQRVEVDSSERAATAMLEAIAGRHDRAVQALQQGYVVSVIEDVTSLPPALLLLETAEYWYQRTHDDRYRAFMAKIARLTENTDPYPWAYAFEARYTTDPTRRIEAAAATLYLDPLSMRLAALPPDVIEAARRLLATSNPMLTKR